MLSCLKYFLLFLVISTFAGFAHAAPPHVIVSVAPHRYLVERIAGDTVQVDLLVPTGASAHTYEPTPKQVLANTQAALWFRMGEGFEARVLRTLQQYNPKLIVVDLRNGVDIICADGTHHTCCSCHGNSEDLHFWLSARQAQIQAQTIANALTNLLPENTERYQTALSSLLQELKDTDEALTKQLAPVQQRIMMVSHPAYAYFCRDYNFRQLSIEVEGKDPTPQTMNKLLQQARNLHIDRIYAQLQYSTKGAQLFAKQLGAQLVILDPYAENIIDTLHTIANALTEGYSNDSNVHGGP